MRIVVVYMFRLPFGTWVIEKKQKTNNKQQITDQRTVFIVYAIKLLQILSCSRNIERFGFMSSSGPCAHCSVVVLRRRVKSSSDERPWNDS